MMGLNTSASGFFVAGGTLPPDSPSYVKRPADEELFKLALGGEFCHLLTPRQMGKSSLMVRTAYRLREHGVSTAIIDLTSIGTDVTIEQWYLGLLTRLKSQLKLSVDLEAWWTERSSLGAVQRFTDFLRDVVLTEIGGPVVIFIDEIDTTLNLDFSDDFFAAIRVCYNARASDPAFKCLSFVLLGVATPSDLISDPQHTPFNIGRRMGLTDFTDQQAIPLADGLGLPPVEARQVLTWILDWTGGHPYLTQRLCAAASSTENRDAAAVDQLVEKTFLGEQSAQDSNLRFVRDMLTQRAPEKAAVLKTYHRIHAGKAVPDEERSPVKTHLKLSGIVKRKGDHLVVRNRIYKEVFNREWIRQNMPPVPASGFRVLQEWIRQNRPRIAFATIAVAIWVVTLGGYAYYQSTISTPTPVPQPIIEIRAQTFAESFLNTGSTEVRASSLEGLFKLGETDPQYETQAHQLLDTLTPGDKGATLASLFKLGKTDPESERLAYQFFTTLTSDKKATTMVSLFKQGETDPESEKLAYQFFTTLNPNEKMMTLANLFEPPGLEDRARAFFHEKLTPEKQLALFEKADPGAINTQLMIVVQGLYTELQDNNQDNQLLETMAQPLRELNDPMAVNLVTEIEQWLAGHKAYAAGEYQQAVDAYSAAISLNDRNPGTYFDRAIAYAGLGQDEEALADFEKTIRLDEKRALIVDQEIRSNGALYNTLAANRAQYPELVAVVPTPTPALTFTPTPLPTPTPTPSPTPTLTPTQTTVPPTATATHTPRPTVTSPPTATAIHTRPPTPTPFPTAVPQLAGPIALTIYLRDTLTEMGFAALSGDQPNGGMIYEEGKFVYGDAAVQIGATTYHFDKPEVGPGESEQLPDPWRVEFEFAEELVARTGTQAGFDPKKAQFWVCTLDSHSAVGEDHPYSLTIKLYEGNELRESIQVFFTVKDAPDGGVVGESGPGGKPTKPIPPP